MRAADYAEHARIAGRGLRGTRGIRPRTTRNTPNAAADYAEHAESGRGLRGTRRIRPRTPLSRRPIRPLAFAPRVSDPRSPDVVAVAAIPVPNGSRYRRTSGMPGASPGTSTDPQCNALTLSDLTAKRCPNARCGTDRAGGKSNVHFVPHPEEWRFVPPGRFFSCVGCLLLTALFAAPGYGQDAAGTPAAATACARSGRSPTSPTHSAETRTRRSRRTE